VVALLGVDDVAVVLSGAECRRLDQLLAHAIAAYRRDSGGSAVPPALVDVAAAVRRAGETWAARAAEQSVRLDQHIGTVGTATEADPATLPVMTTVQVARELQIGARRVRFLASRGAIPGRRHPRGWLFDRADVVDFTRQRKESA